MDKGQGHANDCSNPDTGTSPMLRYGLCLLMAVHLASPAAAQPRDAFSQAVAIAADTDATARFYQERQYRPLWTGADAAERRALFLTAITDAADQGLPVARYDAPALIARLKAVETSEDLARIEVAFTRAFIQYAQDLRSGVLVPARVDATIVRDVVRRDPQVEIAAFEADPAAFLRTLPPQDPEYARLVRAGRLIVDADWGSTVAGGIMRPGESGGRVVALRDRLVAMGYLGRSASAAYDDALRGAVMRFQTDHGLAPDGVAGEATLREINVGPEQRHRSIIVALERHRWMNAPRGERHIWVNLTDFSTQIVDGGEVTFSTRSVIGKATGGQYTPEFSDEMDHMVINPSWFVPRSITTAEYLPQLQRNPNAASHMKIVDASGREINRNAVNFNAYSARSFPFSMRQPPSQNNALGLVKFMFPNKWNIYLHDTPSKSLFDRPVRAFSHGCVRLADPFDFAYALLSQQSDNPEGDFQRILATGKETRVNFQPAIPVHLVYFTATAPARGMTNYRADIYGRDAAIWDALEGAGVAIGQVQG